MRGRRLRQRGASIGQRRRPIRHCDVLVAIQGERANGGRLPTAGPAIKKAPDVCTFRCNPSVQRRKGQATPRPVQITGAGSGRDRAAPMYSRISLTFSWRGQKYLVRQCNSHWLTGNGGCSRGASSAQGSGSGAVWRSVAGCWRYR
jgi:hypothetical protein